MRFETHRVSEKLVHLLQASHAVRQVLVDGGDIIEFVLTSGETVSLHLIESEMALYETEQVLQANGRRGVYTLLFFWRDMLLPDHGQTFTMDVSLAAWSALYGGKIYGYDFNGPDIYLFPVHFDATERGWVARFGLTIDPKRLVVREVRLGEALPGLWRVAAFDGDEVLPEIEGMPRSIADCYTLLEISPGVSRLQVKHAYWRMARQLHPDISDATDANARMQALNEAYRAVLEHLDFSEAD
jgi:hypothetical protein